MCVYPERCLTYPWKKNSNLKKNVEKAKEKERKRKKLKEKNKVGAARARTSYLKIREE